MHGVSESRRQPGPRTIPSLPRNHVLRRSEFEALERALFGEPAPRPGGDSASGICGVHGPAGAGKTVLAAAVAHSPLIARRFPDGVFWLTMGREPRLTVLQAQLAQKVRKPRVFDTAEQGRKKLARLLTEQTVLLVLDDVWNLDHAAMLDVVSPQGRLLVTTRDRSILHTLGAREIELAAASPQQAQVLLARWAGCHPTDLPDDAARIAERVGRLPLSLAMLGAAAGIGKTPWRELHAALQEAAPRPDDAGLDGLESVSYQQTVRTTQICLEGLPEELRAAYLELSAFPPSQAIPEEAIEILWGIGLTGMRDRLSDLEKRALIVRDRQWDRVVIHDVQRTCAIAQIPDPSELHGRLADTYGQRWRTREAGTPQRGGHIWQLGYHLVQAGRVAQLRELLWGYDWLDGKLRADGVAELLADLKVAGAPLKLVRYALMMSSRVLVRDPAQLPGQLIGRLGAIPVLPTSFTGAETPEVQSRVRGLLAQARSQRGFSWLRPLMPTLEPPPTRAVPSEILTRDSRPVSLPPMDEEEVPAAESRALLCLAVTPDRQTLVAGYADATFETWAARPPSVQAQVTGADGPTVALALCHDGARAVDANWRGLTVREVATGTPLPGVAFEVDGIREVLVAPDGDLAATATRDGHLRLVSLADSAVVVDRSQHWPTMARMHHDLRNKNPSESDAGATIASGWRFSSAGSNLTGSPTTGRELPTAGLTAERVAWRGVMAWARREGQRYLVTAPPDDTLRLWSTLRAGSVETIEGGDVLATTTPALTINKVAVTSDGLWALSSAPDSSLRLWDLERRSVRTMVGHWNRVTAIAVTPDSTRAVSAALDGTIRVWDLERAAEAQTLDGRADQVTILAISDDGSMVASGSTDGTLVVWDLWGGTVIARFTIEASIVCCVWTEARELAIGDVSGQLHVFELHESRNDRMSRILARAVALDTQRRGAFLDEQCGTDTGLRRDIEWLVAADHQFGDTQPVEPTEYLLEGTRIKQYEITRELGRGGMSRVFLAQDTRLDRPVAMKFLLTQTNELRQQFKKEAKMTAACRHENIVVIHDVDEHLGHPYLVLEYLQGQSLREWLADQDGLGTDTGEFHGPGTPHLRLSPARTLKLIIPVVRALVHAHAIGIVHRDLKPENIFITESGTVKVLDFGIAKAVSAHRKETSDARALVQGADVSSGHLVVQDGRLIGTPAYMSPEQWGTSEVDHRTDIWSVGLILFELMLGRHPLAPLSAERVSRIAELDLPMPQARDRLPDTGELAAVIDRCLMKHPGERFPSAQELLRALSVPHIPTPDLPAPMREQLTRSSARISVKSGSVAHGLGTGWLVAPDLVVTAFRVVGDPASSTWRHEMQDNARYALEVVDTDQNGRRAIVEISLEPEVFDAAAELALLRCERSVPTLSVIELAAKAPVRGAAFRSQAFPESHDRGVALAGTVAELRGDDAASSLRLSIEDGRQMRWRGVPGAPILNADTNQVLGVITQLTDDTAIGWGATVNAVRRLLQRHREGADKNRLPGSWRRCLDRIMRHLRNDGCIGVALLERSGFGARDVADELVRRLRQSEERLLPIRLAPDRSSTSEARIYKKLLRGLRTGLERIPELGIPHEWWRQFWSSPNPGEPWEQFENAIDELLFGPLAEKQRRLLLLVDGLARLPKEQVVRWGYMMKGLCDDGLQLVVWGSLELHELTVAPQHVNESSAFHHLERVPLPALDRDDVEDLAEAHLDRDTSAVANWVYALTGGHPALVRDAFAMPIDVLLRKNSDELMGRLLGSTHMERLRREVERDDSTRALLQEFARSNATDLPREPLSQVEKRLWWLGVLEESPAGWRWFAPTMRRLAEDIA